MNSASIRALGRGRPEAEGSRDVEEVQRNPKLLAQLDGEKSLE